jgi:hypothetical protein
VAALVAAVALSACGGGEDGLSESEYREQAQKVSDTFDSKFGPALQKSRTGGEEQQLEGIEELGASSDEAAQELDKLQPPSEFQEVHDKLAGSLTKVGDGADALTQAAAAEDQEQIESTRTTFQQSLTDLQATGEEFDKKVGTK